MGQERPWRLRTGAVHKRICWRDDVTVSLNNSHHRRMKFSVHAKPGYGPARHWFERKREGRSFSLRIGQQQGAGDQVCQGFWRVGGAIWRVRH